MKKEKPFILVILCMFFLLLLIVIPPVFRKYIPKEEVKISNTKQIKLLTCNKVFSDNIHTASSTSKYINNKLITNTIKFTTNINEGINSSVQNNETVPNPNIQEHSYDEEYQNLINLKNVNVTTVNNITTVVIDEKIADANKGSDGIMYYFQSFENQKGFYGYMGYTCSVIEG